MSLRLSARELAGRLLPVAIVLLAYLSFATDAKLSPRYLALDLEPKEGYQFLTKGFFDGQLSLSVKPSKEMLELPDPYDPRCHMGLALFDTAYYKGAYYLVHGPLPVLAVYLPVRALSGRYPNGRLAALIFGLLCFGGLYGSLIHVKDRYFPAGEESYVPLGGLCLGFGNLAMAMLAGVSNFEKEGRSFYFTACAAAAAALALGAYCILKAFGRERPSAAWLALGSACVAAGAAARPSMALACCVFLAGISAWLCWSRHAVALGPLRRRQLALAAWAPALVIGALLALYNYGRFEDPLNFGLIYQLNHFRGSEDRYFDRARWALNAWADWKAYFLQRPIFFGYFPFVRGYPWELQREGLRHSEELIGFFSFWPAGWLLLALPWSLRRWQRSGPPERSGLALSLGLIAAVALGALLLLCSFSGVSYRYMSDFAPLLLLLLAVQAWLLQDLGLPRPWPALLHGVFVLSAAHGILLSLAYSFWGFRGSYLQVLPRLLVNFKWG